MKRIVIYKNGSQSNGKIINVTESLEELLMKSGEKLSIEAKTIFTAQGGEIDDIALIRDDEVLYVSSGEPFINLNSCMSCTKRDSKSEGEVALIPGTSITNPDWLLLNVGGKHFATTRSTLTTKEPNSMLACMIASEESSVIRPSSVDSSGAFLIDRSPIYFEPILNYLRHGQLIIDRTTNPEGVLEEARFFGIESLVEELEKIVQEEHTYGAENAALTRRDVINVLISTPFSSELRFQGINMSEADLSRLDLRYINFKYANLHGAKLTGANLSYCCLERTDLSQANLEGAVLLGVKMLCANLEGANLRACNMEDPAGNRANLEGVNLKGANLEGSQMAGVNLRVATLKNANLQNCDLRGAVLAGADLEDSNEQVAAKLRSAGRTVYSYAVDVTDEQQVIQAANKVKQDVGDVYLLINNAGVFSGQSLVNLPSHIIRRCFEVNSMAHFWMLQQFLPRMIELDRGHIVTVASIAGHQGVANMTDYCASKHAAVGMMESLYMELQSQNKRNIRLTTINPIIITTGLISNVKSRFPCLLPLMSVEKTANIVVNSILKEKEEVFIPGRSKFLKNLMECFSRRTRFRIMEYVNYGFDPVVSKEPKKGAEIV